MTVVNDDGKRVLLPGVYNIYIGGGQPGYSAGASTQFTILGDSTTLLDTCSEEVPRYFCADFDSM